MLTFETSRGNTRYVVRDGDGNEYTTFREAIGNKAQQLQGRRVRIEYHENQKGQYTNVYLDKVEPLTPTPSVVRAPTPTRTRPPGGPRSRRRPGWSANRSRGSRSRRQLYEKLKPFKEQVAEDIRESEAHGPA